MIDSYQNPYVVAASPEDVRASFIRKTYAHLAGAIAAFIAIEFALFQIPGIEAKVFSLLATSPYSWLIVLGVWMAGGWLAEKWANSSTSMGIQYAGLALYIAIVSVVFLPLLLLASSIGQLKGTNLIAQAGVITGALTMGLTLIAFTTKKDFSFMGGILKVGSMVALGLIVASIVFKFDLGIIFAAAMVLLMAGSILYTTSNIIHHYGTTQYVAASLSLFASVALLFWYVLRILIALTGRD